MLYQNNIPNGNSVPDPCNSGGTWAAVGHYDPKVGSALTNKFAKDFAAAGHTWTRELCMKDSDEDTYTNGQELGDPNCNWTPGNQPERAAFGHPGIYNLQLKSIKKFSSSESCVRKLDILISNK
ncbi:hypothetical protein KUTeg_016852 [Tegillarca granosa]|uniref:Temptin Cys/Cys disulfide domain-containing protein n=1 Tax=Tegillarca granosa TaxID=220873 RepID=A0ABQ9EM22_TEGGR|nr:hypothetical protein KUTeg_016852 [Tegillarca granosa]